MKENLRGVELKQIYSSKKLKKIKKINVSH